MSGRPSPEGVAAVLATLCCLEAVETSLAQLIPERERVVKAAQEASERRVELQRRLNDQLVKMDVDTSGNYGWESRFGWLLAEFRRQLLAGPRDRSKENEP